MEQKQLDELEDAFFGEELIEDLEDLPPVNSTKNQEIKIEPREQSAELRLQKPAKKLSSVAAKKSTVKKSEKNAAVKSKEISRGTSKQTEMGEKLSTAEKETAVKEKEQKEKKSLETKPLETSAKKETTTVSIKPAKEPVKTQKSEAKSVVDKLGVETSPPVNPWEDEEKSSGLFKETATWKALTGVALVLLVLSLFTQGFNFSEKNAVTGAATVSLKEAEQKILEFVNTQLLQPPFQAEVGSSEELETLYKVTLTVAGQTVDSFVTKDGKLFFPQGFDMDKDKSLLEGAGVEQNEPVATVVEENKEEPVNPSKPELASEASEEPQEAKEAEEPVATEQAGETVELTLNAKKWVFSPNVLRVKKGSKVVLTVVPTELDFTFAVPSLGVEQEIVGTTEVVFTADKAGTFDFVCGSCEDWRGMRGNLVVESQR